MWQFQNGKYWAGFFYYNNIESGYAVQAIHWNGNYFGNECQTKISCYREWHLQCVDRVCEGERHKREKNKESVSDLAELI